MCRTYKLFSDKLEKPHPTFRDLAIDIVNHFSGGKLTRLAPTFDQFLRFVDCEETSGISGHVSLNRHWKVGGLYALYHGQIYTNICIINISH